jgi:hypothetical protein
MPIVCIDTSKPLVEAWGVRVGRLCMTQEMASFAITLL